MTKPNDTEARSGGRLWRLIESARRAMTKPVNTEPMCTESGFRDPFVEVPADRLPRPELIPPQERQRRAFEDAFEAALTQLTKNSHVDSARQFHEKLERVSGLLWRNYDYMDERISALHSTVSRVGWLMEQRIEQLWVLRCYVRELCPRSLAEKVLWEGTERRFRDPDAEPPTDAPSCSDDEHVCGPGAPRCECGRVAVRSR